MSGDEERPVPATGGEDLTRALARVDHIVLATPDVDDTADRLSITFGVRAVPGGRHPDWGTRNALFALGDDVYLEIVGPDLEAPAPEAPRPFGIDDLSAPRVATWAVKGRSLDALVVEARSSGIDLGEVHRRTRRRPDGALLGWSMTASTAPRADGIIPFFIDWGVSPHPATTSPRCGTLVGLRARHPEAAQVRAMLKSLGLDLHVESGEAARLIATIETPRGRIELD